MSVDLGRRADDDGIVRATAHVAGAPPWLAEAAARATERAGV